MLDDFKAKIHQIRFRLRLRSRLRLTALPQAPTGFKGAASRQGGKRKEWRKGGERDQEGREGREREWMMEERGKVTEVMGGTGQDMGWDGMEGKGEREKKKWNEREGRGYSLKLQFLQGATPAQSYLKP